MSYYYIVNKIVDLDSLKSSIFISNMTNKSLIFLRWDSIDFKLECNFISDLSYEDKTILDTIIAGL